MDRIMDYTKALQALGTYLLSIVTGLLVYQTPPESMAQFWQWFWQPNLQGLMMALGVFGIHHTKMR